MALVRAPRGRPTAPPPLPGAVAADLDARDGRNTRSTAQIGDAIAAQLS